MNNRKHKSSRSSIWRYVALGISSTFLLALASCNSNTPTATPSPTNTVAASPSPTTTPSPSPTTSTPSPSPTTGTSIFTTPSPSPTSPATSNQDPSSTRVKQARARHFTGTLNRLSRAYFVENDRFTGDLDQLLAVVRGSKPNSPNYDFSLALIDEKKAVQTIVVAKLEGLKSYTGVVYTTSSQSNGTRTRAIVCESDRPTQERPAAPEIANNEAKCPSGYTQLN